MMSEERRSQQIEQKQIEEMAKQMCGAIDNSCIHDCTPACGAREYAKRCFKAGYRKASDVLEIADDLLHDLAMEYAERGHKDYFAVCENVHLKVIAKLIAEMRQEVEK